MCPAIVRREDGFSFALGASGGRRIMPAVMQNISFMVDCRLGLSEAIHHPRIDVSGGAREYGFVDVDFLAVISAAANATQAAGAGSE